MLLLNIFLSGRLGLRQVTIVHVDVMKDGTTSDDLRCKSWLHLKGLEEDGPATGLHHPKSLLDEGLHRVRNRFLVGRYEADAPICQGRLVSITQDAPALCEWFYAHMAAINCPNHYAQCWTSSKAAEASTDVLQLVRVGEADGAAQDAHDNLADPVYYVMHSGLRDVTGCGHDPGRSSMGQPVDKHQYLNVLWPALGYNEVEGSSQSSKGSTRERKVGAQVNCVIQELPNDGV
ncbi:hypothetical protein ABVT39_011061 [Epinephelus coioides]